MGILIVGLALVTLILSISMALRSNKSYVRVLGSFLVAVGGTIIAALVVTFAGHDPPPQYNYEATINLNNRTTICFAEYAQNGDTITIGKYTVATLHWTNFNRYDVITEPLTIKLLDNDNQFIYTERATGKEFGRPNIATQ